LGSKKKKGKKRGTCSSRKEETDRFLREEKKKGRGEGRSHLVCVGTGGKKKKKRKREVNVV